MTGSMSCASHVKKTGPNNTSKSIPVEAAAVEPHKRGKSQRKTRSLSVRVDDTDMMHRDG